MSEQPRIRKVVEDHAPWKPAKYEPADVSAMQALARGDCPAHLQRRAINFIVYQLCGTYDLPYRPGDEGRRDTDFALGKMWVGQQIAKLMHVPLKADGEQP